MAVQYTYVMKGLSKTYPGGRQVLKDIWLSFLPGAKIGIVGVNGAGKSTLLRIMAGQDKEFTGEAWAADGVKVGYLQQEPQLDPSTDVLGNVMAAVASKKALLDRYNEIAANYTDETADEMSSLQDQIEAQGLWDLDSQVEMAMDSLRCPEPDADVSKLSGGEKRRVALCRLLLEAPDILLLDEPTNHLDAESVAWLEHTLREYKGTIVLVTHDRYFLDNVTGWILELDRGRGIPHEGNYTSFLDMQDKRLLQEGASEEARERTLAREREWIKQSPRARQAKSKARINAYEELLAKSQENRRARADHHSSRDRASAPLVVEAKDVGKAYGDRLLFEHLEFNLPAGGIVGVIGPNGAGKTTLFRIMTGQEKPDAGTLRVGDSVVIGYVDQSRDTLDPEKNVWEEISGGLDVLELGKRTMQSRRLCGGVQLQGRRPAEKGRQPIGRRAQPRASGQDAEIGRQPASARRTDQRSRCGNSAGAGSGARGFRGLRYDHQP